MKRSRSMPVFAGVFVFCAATQAVGQQVDKVLDAEKQRTAAGQAAEQRIGKLADEKDNLVDQYRAVMQEIEGLEVYNRQLEGQVASQQRELAEIEASIERATVVDRQILPLMLRMIGALEQFVKLDVPFLMNERTERVEALKALVERADVTVAEKFRRVLEAYQIENEYGRTIEAYRDTLEVAGKSREVDVLRIGRVGLYYQTLDEDYRGAWDLRERQWQELDSDYVTSLRDGLRIARKQAAPDLLVLPVNAPQAASTAGEVAR